MGDQSPTPILKQKALELKVAVKLLDELTKALEDYSEQIRDIAETLAHEERVDPNA